MSFDDTDYYTMGPTPEQAERMSQSSYEDAIQRYSDMGGRFFSLSGFNGHDETCGQRLAKQLREADDSLRTGRLRAHLLDPGDSDVAIPAFMLPFEIHFDEFTCAADEGDSEEPGYNSIELSCSCEETDMRDDFIDAFYEYCVTAAAVAKEIGDTHAHRLFSRAIDLLDRNCTGNLRYLNDLGGMNQKEADTTFNCTLEGLMSLKTQMIIEERRRERLGLPALAQAFKGAETPAGAPTPPPETQTATAIPFSLGDWAKKVVFEVDAARRSITFRGNKGGAGETLVVPPGSAKAWDLIRRLLASPDENGYIELQEDERYTWRKHFERRIRNPDGTTELSKDDLFRLKMHITRAKGVGERGPTRIRLTRRAECPSRK